jgi:hypothetical protein
MKAQWKVDLKTGYDIPDNDIYRIRELIADALKPMADEYLADLSVTPSYHIPGPIQWVDNDIPSATSIRVVNLPDRDVHYDQTLNPTPYELGDNTSVHPQA